MLVHVSFASAHKYLVSSSVVVIPTRGWALRQFAALEVINNRTSRSAVLFLIFYNKGAPALKDSMASGREYLLRLVVVIEYESKIGFISCSFYAV